MMPRLFTVRILKVCLSVPADFEAKCIESLHAFNVVAEIHSNVSESASGPKGLQDVCQIVI